MKIYCTQHAVDRFRERWGQALSFGHARRELELLASRATHMRERTRAGQEQWLVNDGSGMVLVMKRDAGQRGMIVVTVLPPEAPAVDVDPADLA